MLCEILFIQYHKFETGDVVYIGQELIDEAFYFFVPNGDDSEYLSDYQGETNPRHEPEYQASKPFEAIHVQPAGFDTHGDTIFDWDECFEALERDMTQLCEIGRKIAQETSSPADGSSFEVLYSYEEGEWGQLRDGTEIETKPTIVKFEGVINWKQFVKFLRETE
jgi:hypothetical protein